jgi:hypothetical protein
MTLACERTQPAGPASVAQAPLQSASPNAAHADTDPHVNVITSYDLPREERTQELSGLAWDAAHRTLYAISDDRPLIVPLVVGEGYKTVGIGEPITPSIPTHWDGEGIALTTDGLLIADEAGPHVYETDRAGHLRREIELPDHFSRCEPNKALESLTLSPDGRYLFTANEGPLVGDEPRATTTDGSVVRILRIDRTTNARAEFAYTTDPIFGPGPGGMIGVAEMAALSPEDLLVLERAYVPHVGNRIRVYRTSLRGATDIIGVVNLAPRETPSLKKELVFDVADLPGQDRRSPGASHGLYANYEGMVLGPVERGARILFMVSDDNARPEQAARLLVLAISGEGYSD